MVEGGADETDWVRVLAMTEDELEAAIAADPDWAELPRDWYKDAKPRHTGRERRRVTLRLDSEVLDWFKAQGRDDQARIDAAVAPSSKPTNAADLGTPGKTVLSPSPVKDRYLGR
jgi:uncharacterized protein (DUF4415 family)